MGYATTMRGGLLNARQLLLAWGVISLLPIGSGDVRAFSEERAAKRVVSVADVIEMTRFADPQFTIGQSADESVAQFSPDGKKFVIVLKKGNLKENTNDYSLFLWRTDDLQHGPAPELLVTLSSSSNRKGISDITWPDNDTIAFLGENRGELQQVHTIDLATRSVKTLTNHPTNIVAYTMASDGKGLVFEADGRDESILTDKVRKEGVRVFGTDSMPNLIAGHSGSSHESIAELFLMKADGACVPIKTEGPLSPSLTARPVLSPDGRFLVVRTQTMNLPQSWKGYNEPFLRHVIAEKLPEGMPSRIERYELIDIRSGVDRVLLNTPISLYGSEAAWSPDGQFVALTGVYLPLEDIEPQERYARQNSTFVVAVDIPNDEVVEITPENLQLLGWEAQKHCAAFKRNNLSTKPSVAMFCRTDDKRWELVADAARGSRRPNIILEEDLNTPPRIVAVDPEERWRVLLLDLNPEFSEQTFGKVEKVRWDGPHGREVKGALYLPPNYVSGRRYPLVIQTHGFAPDKFWIDGPFSTVFAAQPLAARGFVVLQEAEDWSDPDTPKEIQREAASFETAIDQLDEIGLIDRNRVGLVGFSRTCLFVKYALTHSKYNFSAAVVADGTDGGYFQYIAFSNANGSWSTFEGINGALPFGEGLSRWIQRSPGFNLDKVHTPTLIQAIGSGSLLAEWEWFSGLTRLDKPVDMIYIPDGVHELTKPWERMVSLESTIDWLSFWLKDEEDPDPVKTEQYAYWRTLRKRQPMPMPRMKGGQRASQSGLIH